MNHRYTHHVPHTIATFAQETHVYALYYMQTICENAC